MRVDVNMGERMVLMRGKKRKSINLRLLHSPYTPFQSCIFMFLTTFCFLLCEMQLDRYFFILSRIFLALRAQKIFKEKFEFNFKLKKKYCQSYFFFYMIST